MNRYQRDFERKRYAEQLQDREDRLARKRQIDTERRLAKRSGNGRSIGGGWIFLAGAAAAAVLLVPHKTAKNPVNAESPPPTIEENPGPVPKNSAALTPAPSIRSGDSASKSVQAGSRDKESVREPDLPQGGDEQTLPVKDEASKEAQDQAIAESFTTGQPERWKAGKVRGYAVPSEIVAGCRNIIISVDGKPDREIVKRCAN